MHTRDELIQLGYKPSILNSKLITYIIFIPLSFLIPIIGSSYWLFLSIKNFTKRNVKFYKYVHKTRYVRDRRFKTGLRPEGQYQIKEYYPNKIPITKKEKKIAIIKGIISLSIFIFIITMQINDLLHNRNLPKEKSIYFNTISAKSGLKLHTLPDINSPIISIMRHGDTIEVLKTKKYRDKQNNSIDWIQIKYKDTLGFAAEKFLKELPI